MIFKNLITAAALAATAFVGSANAEDLPAIEIVGNKFYYSNNGSRFYLKGVAYQQDTANSTDSDFVDPLADADKCKRDVPYLQELQTNVIRVYALDPSEDHTECMEMLQDAGIYVIADLSSPDDSINRNDPKWTISLYDRYTSVIDAFHNYTNILGFFAGNEVTNQVSNTNASAFVKAAVRDSKAYIKAKGYRSIPVGYSANDDTDIRDSLADYFACGSDEERTDFFGINMYEWCGSSSYSKSGYSTITNQYKNLGIPLFFSEYGCNKVQPRRFQEVGTIYGDDMTGVWSGGIVYMYFQEDNDYGLVSVSGDEVSTLSDFSYYLEEIAKVSPSAEYSSTASNSSSTSCPTSTSNWDASTKLPPTPDELLCKCASAAAGCVVDDSVDEDDYGDIFGYICSQIDCAGIETDGSTGVYGAFSPCSSKDQLNFLLNLYYESNDQSLSACDFDGSASVQRARTASLCRALLLSAGSQGTGSVSASINTSKNSSSTSKSNGSSGSNSGSSGSGSNSSSGTSTSTSTGSNSGAGKQVSSEYLTKSLFVAISIALGFGVVFA